MLKKTDYRTQNKVCRVFSIIDYILLKLSDYQLVDYLSIILAIPSSLVVIRKLLERKKTANFDMIKGKRGIVKDFKIPRKIEIGGWSEVSAVYEGQVESGFFSLKITDCNETPQWFGDDGSVKGTHIDTGEYIETGKLNFTNGTYEGGWKFRPEFPLKPGKSKAEVAMFEDKDFVGTDGKTMSLRPQIELQEKEVILY